MRKPSLKFFLRFISFQSWLWHRLQWNGGQAFPLNRLNPNVCLAIEATLECCSISSVRNLLVICYLQLEQCFQLMYEFVWIPHHYRKLETATVFPVCFPCVWFQFLNLFYYVNNALSYIKLFPIMPNIQVMITFHGIRHNFNSLSNAIYTLDNSLVHRLE